MASCLPNVFSNRWFQSDWCDPLKISTVAERVREEMTTQSLFEALSLAFYLFSSEMQKNGKTELNRPMTGQRKIHKTAMFLARLLIRACLPFAAFQQEKIITTILSPNIFAVASDPSDARWRLRKTSIFVFAKDVESWDDILSNVIIRLSTTISASWNESMTRVNHAGMIHTDRRERNNYEHRGVFLSLLSMRR